MAAVVVDVLGRGLAVGQDVVVVPVVYHEDPPRLYQVLEVLKTPLVISLVSVEVGEMGEGIAEDDSSVETPRRLDNFLIDCQPVGLLDHPILEVRLLASRPPCFVSIFQHFVRSIGGSNLA